MYKTLLFNYEKKNFCIYSDIIGDKDNSLFVEVESDFGGDNINEPSWSETSVISVTRRGIDLLPVIDRAERIYNIDIRRILVEEMQSEVNNVGIYF